MTDDSRKITITNPWTHLRRHTPARIALGRSGISIPTHNHLEFQLAHARARNAVHHKLDHEQVAANLRQRWGEVLMLKSAARDRATYLQRPDLGRRLADDSRKLLIDRHQSPCDIVFIVADGLSAFAIETNAVAVLDTLRPHVEREAWTLAPICMVEQGRVAVGDEIGELLKAEIVVMLIGERPGLSSPDSLGLYLTYRPRAGATDADRNCISNVRSEGLSYEEAAYKLHYLISEARRRRLSGVQLKDEAEALPVPEGGKARNFLIDRD